MRNKKALLAMLLARSEPQANGCRYFLKVRRSRNPSRFVKNYGVLVLDGVHEYAHRLMYRLTKGPIPAGFEVLHTCDTPPCIEPAHLIVGTHGDNMKDMRAKGRWRHGAKPRGTAVHTSKLTEDEVLAIRADPRGPIVVAREYGISKSTVKDIRSRKIWSWL